MMGKIKQLLIQYKAVILYLFFGVATTVVNIIAYWLCAYPLHWGIMVSTVVAWIAAVLFAYVTNRKWVFDSKETTTAGIVQEMIRFFGCRLATGVVDWLIMLVFVEWLTFNDMVVKIAANVLVIILNYVASKLVVFRKSK